MKQLLAHIAFSVLLLASLQADPDPFLDETKHVPSKLEWSREIVSKKGGDILLKVDSQGPVSIILITGSAYEGAKAGSLKKIDKADMLVNIASVPTPFVTTVTIPPGSSWFIIQNLSPEPVDMRLSLAYHTEPVPLLR